MKNRFLETGKIVNTHGIAGEVKIMPWADDPEFLLEFDALYIDGKAWEIQSARVHKNCVLVKFEGIADINDAMKRAAAYAIAGLISDEELNEDYILPAAFDPRVGKTVAAAVAKAARETGVARL